MERIEQFVKQVLEEITGESIDDRQLPLLEEELLDSMSILYLVSEIEDEFHVQIPVEEIIEENFKDMESIITYVKNKCNN